MRFFNDFTSEAKSNTINYLFTSLLDNKYLLISFNDVVNK